MIPRFTQQPQGCERQEPELALPCVVHNLQKTAPPLEVKQAKLWARVQPCDTTAGISEADFGGRTFNFLDIEVAQLKQVHETDLS